LAIGCSCQRKMAPRSPSAYGRRSGLMRTRTAFPRLAGLATDRDLPRDDAQRIPQG
jgi:hypothetical protein